MQKKLRIAQLAPLAESVPPQLYGGTERVVSYLTEELVERGHEVTLYASADSRTAARHIPCAPQALRMSHCKEPLAYAVAMCERLMQDIEDYDVVHAHIDYLPFSLFRRSPVPTITTLHGRLDTPELTPIYSEFDDIPLVSISDNQRRPLGNVNWMGTIYHGLPKELGHLYPRSGDYLAFLGRISPEKQVDAAIRIALQAGYPLKIAAKVSNEDYEYYKDHIKPLLDNPLIEFVGEIGEAEKPAFLGRALGLLFMINWPEPFGLAMIEAMSFGTPVIARRCGSVPEVVDEGITGFVCDDETMATKAVDQLESLDRSRIHEVFSRRFSAARMTEDYLTLYRRLIQTHRGRGPDELQLSSRR
ncbi:MAG: glycosyltransferase family 4 protein [Bradymonadaceae bacterium]